MRRINIPLTYRGGMIKRAALARALALDPEIVFLDEPTSGLDPIGAAEFDDLIATLQKTLGLTVFMVTHDMDSVFIQSAIASRPWEKAKFLLKALLVRCWRQITPGSRPISTVNAHGRQAAKQCVQVRERMSIYSGWRLAGRRRWKHAPIMP